MEERNYETEAREQGWKPETEWEGDPPRGGFKSAEQFVKDGENITPILKSKVDRLETRVDELLNTNKQLHEFTQRSIKKEKAEKEKLISELEQVRKKAVTEGDGDAFDRADRQLNELRSDVNQSPEPGIDPLAEKWLEGNPWYAQNEKLQAYADGIAEKLVRQGFTGQAYFDELTRRTKESFPQDFGNPNRSKPNGVEGDTRPGSESKGHTFNDLPAEAKAQYKIFARDIPGFTKEAYLEQYEWDD